jgi:predicted aspartyl protease
MPIIPILIEGHKLWTFVDSGATFSILSVDDAHRIGIEWDKGRRQMIVVGDGVVYHAPVKWSFGI